MVLVLLQWSVGSGDGMAATVFVRQLIQNYVIYYY
jgi:hypothetical protein